MSDISSSACSLHRSILCLCVLALAGARPTEAEWPEWVESWLFNAEERTHRGVDDLSAGQTETASPAFETAYRLDPDNPVTQFNAGTSRLASGNADPSELLSAAAASKSRDIAAAASYNLGNAYLAQDAFPEAIASFKSALRTSPGMADAKFNLELAKKRLEEQQQQQQDQDDSQGDQQDSQDGQDGEEESTDEQDDESESQQEEQQQDQGEQGEQDEQQQDQQDQGEQGEQDEQQQDQQPGEDGQQPPGSQQQESPLPQFTDLADMTAEEAAAILEAVENLEREQRREQALAAARANVGAKKDW